MNASPLCLVSGCDILTSALKKFNLFLVDGFFFELGPNEMGLGNVLGRLEPEATLHNCSDQISVVSTSDVDLEGLLVFGYVEFTVDFMGQVNHEKKFLVFVHFYVYAVVLMHF